MIQRLSSLARPVASVMAGVLLLAACGPSNPEGKPAAGKGGGEEKVVNVYNWSDYIAEDTVAEFTKATGIKVVYDVYDTNEMLESKLVAGASGYDVVFPSARPFAQKQIQAGVFATLDKAKLSNLGNLDPVILKSLDNLDPGNAHVLPYMWGTTGLGINVKKVRELLGPDAPLDSWSLLFDKKYSDKLGKCGIGVLDDEQEAFAAALMWQGLDPNTANAAQNDKVRAAFTAIRPNIRYFHSSQYIEDLANGDICMAMGYSGDIFQAADRAEEAGNGIELQYIIPKEGAVRWVDVMGVPKDAPHPENALAFINFLMQPKVAAGISDFVAYASPNVPARAVQDPEIAKDPLIYPPPEVVAKLVDPQTLDPDAQRDRVRLWTTIKTGQ
jgi:putrescine transport system substrate-binding protein